MKPRPCVGACQGYECLVEGERALVPFQLVVPNTCKRAWEPGLEIPRCSLWPEWLERHQEPILADERYGWGARTRTGVIRSASQSRWSLGNLVPR